MTLPARTHATPHVCASFKDRVLDLLARITRVSVETVRIVEVLKAGPR